MAPEADAFTYSQIAGHAGVTVKEADYSGAAAADILADLRTITNEMDELEVTTGSRILFITPTLRSILDDFSHANPERSNRVLTRFSRIVDVPQTCFCTAIDLQTGDAGKDGVTPDLSVYATIAYVDAQIAALDDLSNVEF